MKKASARQFSSYGYRKLLFIAFTFFTFSFGFGQTVTIDDVSGAEDGGAITVTATLDVAVPGGFSVDVSTNDGSATLADSDYTQISSQTLSFAGTIGETQTFDVIPTLDSTVEGDESLTITMDNLLGTITPVDISDTATVTINNDDSVIVEFSQATGSDAENVGGNLPTLFITGTVVAATTVTVTDAGTGDATSGVDYAFTSPQVVNIPAATYDGTSGTAIAIPTLSITGDTDVEANETIDLALSAPTGDATLGGQTTTTYTINNDDSVIVEFSQATGSDAENVGGNLPTLFITGTVVAATTV
ncbi:Calx-beta domain-containing protein, partial [Flagellimonas sp. S3867]|uniref:Calx-beta domain-containing protein n=1 Tax=Flagellimonas sp. S3867 TaxID=2768063 RepID=UPI00272E2577